MNTLNLPNNLDQAIVDGILLGYKNYLTVRKQAQEKLKVSGAYAWVKGNHIDSSVYEVCAKFDNVASSIQRAGYAWEYLQFILKNTSEKYLLIIKGSQTTNKTFNNRPKAANEDNYLFNLAGINNNISKLPIKSLPREVQLELSLPELQTIQNNSLLSVPGSFSRFYVVTYELDDQSKMIASIHLTLPEQQSMSLIEVADLTSLMDSSNIKITDIELETVQGDKIPDSIYTDDKQSFGYGVTANKNQSKDKNEQAN